MDIYPLEPNDDGHIGVALIINNFKFHSYTQDNQLVQPNPRWGSDEDVKNISISLNNLGFKVEPPLIDLTAVEMQEIVQHYAAKVDFFTSFSCFVCVIMSHGHTQSQIFGVDHNSVHLIDQLIAPIKECPSLRGKPKLFFVNACRGDSKNVFVEDESDSLFRSVHDLDDEMDSLVHKDADVLIHYATVESMQAIRNTATGSYFIQAMCYVLDNYARKENVEISLLLCKVNDIVATEFEVQMPEISSTLRNLFYFNLNRDTLPKLDTIETPNRYLF
jgi:hypothetical protein